MMTVAQAHTHKANLTENPPILKPGSRDRQLESGGQRARCCHSRFRACQECGPISGIEAEVLEAN